MTWNNRDGAAEIEEGTRDDWAKRVVEMVRNGDDAANISSGDHVVFAMRVGDGPESDAALRVRIINAHGMWGAFCSVVLESSGEALDECARHVGLERLTVQQEEES